MSALDTIEACWAAVEGRLPWQGYQAIVVTASTEILAESHQRRIEALFERASHPPVVHVVVERGAPLGKMAGTLAAWHDYVRTGGPTQRVAIVHDAGQATRTQPLTAVEPSRGAVQLPGSWGRSYAQDHELRLLDLVLVSIQVYGASCPGLDVFWGSQVVVPASPPSLPTATMTQLAAAPSGRERDVDLADLGLHALHSDGQPAGFLAPGALGSLDALEQWRAEQAAIAWDIGAFRLQQAAIEGLVDIPSPDAIEVLPPGSVWQRYRRPAEHREAAELMAGSTDTGLVLRAAHRIRHPIERVRLGDVFIDGPEVSWEDVRHGVEVGGVLIQRSIVRHCTLLPGSAVSDSVIEDCTGRVEAERSLVLGSAVPHAIVQRGLLYKVVSEEPMGVSDGVTADVTRAPRPPLERDVDESVPAHRLRQALVTANRARLLDLSLLASTDAGRMATRELLARTVRDCERLTRSSRDSACRELIRLWTALYEHPVAAPVASMLARAGFVDGAALQERYARVRRNERLEVPSQPQRIVVLSRVTLGADIAITSVLLQRLRARFPDSPITLVADRGAASLIGACPGVRPYLMRYPRSGSLGERLVAWSTVTRLIDQLGADLVVAADSRIDQLGSLPSCPEERYAFIETSFAGEVRPWAVHINAAFDTLFGPGAPAAPAVWLDGAPPSLPQPCIALKLQAAGARDKTLSVDFERRLLQGLLDQGHTLVVDRGIGDEIARSDAVLASTGQPVVQASDAVTPSLGKARILAWKGSIGGWARLTSGCTRAIAYDSVHGHLSAAIGLPTTVLFAGQPTPDFATAWAPPGARVIDAADRDEDRILAEVLG